MIGIPVAFALFGYGEWAAHKYLLHGLGRDRKSRFAFHYHEHHQAVRRNGFYDPAYEGPVWSTPTQSREAIGLAVIAAVHAPLFPIAPFYTSTVWYCLYRYRRDHRRAHLDPQWMRDHHIPSLTAQELGEQAGTFDVITAIEVVEHLTDPVGAMGHIASLLKPGGHFFLTTGNAEPHRDRLERWSYVHPDVHVTYFEPRTLVEVYRRAGLESHAAGFLPGHADIIRYKVLKTMGIRNRNVLERMVPWRLVSRVVDRRRKKIGPASRGR